VQHKVILYVQKKEWRPLNCMKKDTFALWRSLFILSFEFEYRVVSSAHSLSFLNPNPHPKGRDLLLFCSCCLLFGGSEFFLKGSDCTGYSQQRFQRSEVSRLFSEVPNSGI
jgi:hypothetical protein